MSRALLASRDARIELHLHLEGAAPVNFIRLTADDKGMWREPLMSITDHDKEWYFFDGFEGFLRVYGQVASVLQTPLDYYELIHLLMHWQAEEGILYTEVFVSPDLCGGGDLGAWREYLAAIEQGARDAEAIHGTILRAIVTAIRHEGPDQAERAARCAAETAGEFVVGFGLAGDERVLAPRDFAYAFDAAREAGLGLTAHAGEMCGHRSVLETLDALGVSRIGHGIAAAYDQETMRRLLDEEIVLECCPGSNVMLGHSRDFATHEATHLRARGVAVTISTDDPPFFQTSMTTEYARLEAEAGWTVGDFRDINRTAAEAAFCDAATKRRIIGVLEGENE